MLAEAEPLSVDQLTMVRAKQIIGVIYDLRCVAEELLAFDRPLPALHRFHAPFMDVPRDLRLLPILLPVCRHPHREGQFLVAGNLAGFYTVRSVAEQTKKDFQVPVVVVDIFALVREELEVLEINRHAFNLTDQHVHGPSTAAIIGLLNASIARGTPKPSIDEIEGFWGLPRHTARRIFRQLRISGNVAPKPPVYRDETAPDFDFSDVPF